MQNCHAFLLKFAGCLTPNPSDSYIFYCFVWNSNLLFVFLAIIRWGYQELITSYDKLWTVRLTIYYHLLLQRKLYLHFGKWNLCSMHLTVKLSRAVTVCCFFKFVLFFTFWDGMANGTDLCTPLDSSLCILGATYLQKVCIADLVWAIQVSQILKPFL